MRTALVSPVRQCEILTHKKIRATAFVLEAMELGGNGFDAITNLRELHLPLRSRGSDPATNHQTIRSVAVCDWRAGMNRPRVVGKQQLALAHQEVNGTVGGGDDILEGVQ